MYGNIERMSGAITIFRPEMHRDGAGLLPLPLAGCNQPRPRSTCKGSGPNSAFAFAVCQSGFGIGELTDKVVISVSVSFELHDDGITGVRRHQRCRAGSVAPVDDSEYAAVAQQSGSNANQLSSAAISGHTLAGHSGAHPDDPYSTVAHRRLAK